ncbi:hypothetical protein ACFSC6_19530 [Rufibacter sediminis]|uniref:Uncharacterized protein n=1 Tax=Rufibacter sediminis TaxID=2762756 RepID=A0ABR6VN75_9BACT|nr:hypothetical protein [Rufibacter sediminis]MBC3538639.1 hypothetical protein [Rufibacter sediminis]
MYTYIRQITGFAESTRETPKGKPKIFCGVESARPADRVSFQPKAFVRGFLRLNDLNMSLLSGYSAKAASAGKDL